jgi:hypothetical protein
VLDREQQFMQELGRAAHDRDRNAGARADESSQRHERNLVGAQERAQPRQALIQHAGAGTEWRQTMVQHAGAGAQAARRAAPPSADAGRSSRSHLSLSDRHPPCPGAKKAVRSSPIERRYQSAKPGRATACRPLAIAS